MTTNKVVATNRVVATIVVEVVAISSEVMQVAIEVDSMVMSSSLPPMKQL